MGATEANIEIALYGMKSSIFGCAFLLDHGGYFWCTLCHALRNWRNPEWKPLSGTDGLRVGGKVQKALLHKCRVFYGDDFVLVAYSRLEKTTPGQIMIWQAENPMPPSTRSNWGPNCSFMSSKPGWSKIGNISDVWSSNLPFEGNDTCWLWLRWPWRW